MISEDARWVESPSRTRCFAAFERVEHGGKLIDRNAQTAHAGINFQVHGMLRHAERGGRGFHDFDVPWLPDSRREAQANDLGFFAAPETGHQQNIAADAGLAQRNGFVERSDAEPACAFGLKRPRAFDGAVTVGIRLHYGTHGNIRTDMLLHDSKILPQRGERDFRPGGTRCYAAQNFCCGCHFRDYSGSSPCAEVTLGLLPLESVFVELQIG